KEEYDQNGGISDGEFKEVGPRRDHGHSGGNDRARPRRLWWWRRGWRTEDRAPPARVEDDPVRGSRSSGVRRGGESGVLGLRSDLQQDQPRRVAAAEPDGSGAHGWR